MNLIRQIFTQEIIIISMLLTMFLFLLTGYPVAFTIAGVPLLFALFGQLIGIFDMSYVAALPNRIYGIMTNDLLISVPLFVFMGVMLQKSKIAEELLESMAVLMSNVRSGLTISVTLVGALLAASTGIVGATVVTMGLLSLPTMLKKGYSPSLSTGTICAAGTLGQIIPPSIVLILLSDQISASYQQAQLELGNFSPESVSVTDLFVGALIPVKFDPNVAFPATSNLLAGDVVPIPILPLDVIVPTPTSLIIKSIDCPVLALIFVVPRFVDPNANDVLSFLKL